MNLDVPICGQRISIVGTSGSGKTTLARQISQRLAIPHVELDAFNHEPNWTEAPIDIFRKRVEQSLSRDSWVVDGNYSKVRDIVWSRADIVVWLDKQVNAFAIFSQGENTTGRERLIKLLGLVKAERKRHP